MPRDLRLYLNDLVDACEHVRAYTADLDFSGFVADRRTVDAVLHNLQVVGEAAKRLPSEMLAGAPEVPWRDVTGLRDILVHTYFKVDLAVIWRIVRDDLPTLEAAARRLAAGYRSPP